MENANSVRLMQGFQKYNPNTFGMVPKVYETIQKKIMDSKEVRKIQVDKLEVRTLDGTDKRVEN